MSGAEVIPFPTILTVMPFGSCWATIVNKDACWLDGDKWSAIQEARELAARVIRITLS